MKKYNGQSVIEVLIALSIAVVTIVALVRLASRSLSSSGSAKRQSQGVAIASKITEAIRATEVMLGWDGFRAAYPDISPASYCYDFSIPFPTPAIKTSGCTTSDGFGNNIAISYITPTPAGPLTLNAQVNVTGDDNGRVVATQQSVQLIKGIWSANVAPTVAPSYISTHLTGVISCSDYCTTHGHPSCSGGCTATANCSSQVNISWEVSKPGVCFNVGSNTQCADDHLVPAAFGAYCCCAN